MGMLTKYDPVDDFFRGFFVRPVEFGKSEEMPPIRIDVTENPEGYEVHAEVPGVRKEDIHVHVEGALVSITAERKQENEVKQGDRVLRSERYFGKISRSFQLGQEVDESRTVAKFADGVLTLKLPRKAEKPAHKIAIQ